MIIDSGDKVLIVCFVAVMTFVCLLSLAISIASATKHVLQKKHQQKREQKLVVDANKQQIVSSYVTTTTDPQVEGEGSYESYDEPYDGPYVASSDLEIDPDIDTKIPSDESEYIDQSYDSVHYSSIV